MGPTFEGIGVACFGSKDLFWGRGMSSHRCGEELELVLEVEQHQLDTFKNITHVRKKAEMSANLISRKPYQTINHLPCFEYNFFKTTHTH